MPSPPPTRELNAEGSAKLGGAQRVHVALGLIVILGAVLRLWHLGTSSLGFDESFTGMVGRLPLGSIFGFLRAHDSHPPLDYLLQLPVARAGRACSCSGSLP